MCRLWVSNLQRSTQKILNAVISNATQSGHKVKNILI